MQKSPNFFTNRRLGAISAYLLQTPCMSFLGVLYPPGVFRENHCAPVGLGKQESSTDGIFRLDLTWYFYLEFQTRKVAFFLITTTHL